MKLGDLLSFDVPSPWLRAKRGAARAFFTLGIPCALLWLLTLWSALGGERFVGSGRVAGLDLWAASVLYPASILLAGAIAGAGAPFARSSARAALLGGVAGVIGCLCLALTFESPGPMLWTRWVVIGTVTGVLLGVPLGVSTFRGEHRDPDQKSRRSKRGSGRHRAKAG